jgi:lipopolysaccharide exporter
VARILSPDDFGVFAVALVMFTIVINISELGVGTAIVREHERLDEIAPTAVTLSIVSSTLLAALMYILAPNFAAMLGSEAAAVPISVLSIVVLLAGPSAVPASLLTRDFMQGRRFAADMANFAASNVVLMGLALSGWGVMAFVWSRVAGQLVAVIMLLLLCPRKYLPGFRSREAKQLIVFGLPIIGSSLVGYTISSASVIAVGRALGTVPLGNYTLASNVTNWPLSLFSSVIDSLGLPVFSRVQGEPDALHRYLRNALRLIAASFFYVTAMCMSLAQPLIATLYGSKWAAAGPVLACFAAYGTFRVLIALFTVILIACNAPRRLFWTQVVWLIALIPSVLAGVSVLGILGAALANVIVTAVVVLPLTLWQVRQASGLAVVQMLKSSIRPLAAAAGAGAVAYYASMVGTEPWSALFIGGTLGSAFYVAVLAGWLRELMAETRILHGTITGGGTQ